MHSTGREAPCPNCGGPIEFKMGAAAAVICPWCRFSVVRKGVALEAIGKVADLVPTTPMMAVGDRGTLRGQRFVVGGRLQLDHGRGPWDEWYIEFPERGQWGWLAYAQGFWYLTFPVEMPTAPPPWEAMRPGQRGQLPGTGELTWTVAEQGHSVLLSAEGELPFPPPPQGSRGRYVDLSGPNDEFATLDYGDGSEPPRLFAGERIPASEVQFERGGGPRPLERAQAGRLRCPSCGGPIELQAPQDTQRAVCPSCSALLDFQGGELRYLQKLEQARAEALVPLGARGNLRGTECLCIGMMEREVVFDGEAFRWQEYLLHTPAGYRWLLQDSGHWLWVEPVNAAEVQDLTARVTWRGQQFKAFQAATSTVRFVIGEFYWQVQLGDETWVEDYVAPPRVLSREKTEKEERWSLGTYVEPEEVWRAFGLPGTPPPRTGVHPAQPNPARRLPAAIIGLVTALLVVLVSVVASAARYRGDELVVNTIARGQGGNLQVPPLPDPEMQRIGEKRPERSRGRATPVTATSEDPRYVAVSVTPPFEVPRRAPGVRVDLSVSGAQRAWVGVALALVDQNSGRTREFTLEVDNWDRGVSSGSASRTLKGLKPGRYLLRAETRWAASPERAKLAASPRLQAAVGVRALPEKDASGACLICALLFAFIPLLLESSRYASFEKKRWENSGFQAPLTGIGAASGLAAGVWAWGGDADCGGSSCGGDCGSGCGGGCGGGCGD